MRLLLDEMYSATHGEAFRDASIDALTVADLGLAGRSDLDLFAAAAADGYVLLSENVADFARISADHLGAGRHHPGILIALSSRFSRRPAGCGALVVAVLAISGQPIEDRVVFLERTDQE